MNISIYLYISNAQFLETIVSNLDGSITLIDFYYILHNMNYDWLRSLSYHQSSSFASFSLISSTPSPSSSSSSEISVKNKIIPFD